MGNKKNRILLILMIVLSFVGIIWQLFSFMGIGLIYKYDLCKIPYNIIMDKIIWNSLKISYILNSSFLLISLFFRSHIKRKDIRRILYLIAIGATVLFVLFWEYNYMKLLIELPEHRNQLSNYLRGGGYYTYAIGTIIIYVLLLWLNKARRKMMNVHNLDIAESENPSE